ncbi:hypothetical protein [Sorangium sp. So ce542]|uniref:hypothetical protein n=1 Tax=Sorangium sp. So ce542 TaxID=3133316 RepID=UPI003F5E785A
MNKMVLLVLCVAAISLPAAEADARGTTPHHGRVAPPSDASCFSISWGRLTNSSCTGYREIVVNAVIDASDNNHDFNIMGKGTGSTVVRCYATARSPDGATGSSVYADRAVSSWGWLNKAAPTLYVPSEGSMYFNCEIPQTGGVSSFHWTP